MSTTRISVAALLASAAPLALVGAPMTSAAPTRPAVHTVALSGSPDPCHLGMAGFNPMKLPLCASD